MGCETKIRVTSPPPGICFPAKWWSWIRNAFRIEIDNCGNGVKTIRSVNAPGIDDSTATWQKIDENNCPKGDFIFVDGKWRKKPTVPIGARMYYTGPVEGYFDSATYKGLVGGEWDGWRVDFTDANKMVVIGGALNPTTDLWESNVSGSSVPSGGNAQVLLTLANVPSATIPAVTLGRMKADANGPDAGGILYGQGSNAITVSPAVPGNSNPIPFSILPPYIVKAELVYEGVCI